MSLCIIFILNFGISQLLTIIVLKYQTVHFTIWCEKNCWMRSKPWVARSEATFCLELTLVIFGKVLLFLVSDKSTSNFEIWSFPAVPDSDLWRGFKAGDDWFDEDFDDEYCVGRTRTDDDLWIGLFLLWASSTAAKYFWRSKGDLIFVRSSSLTWTGDGYSNVYISDSNSSLSSNEMWS